MANLNSMNEMRWNPTYDEAEITFGDWCLVSIALLTNLAVAAKIVWTALIVSYRIFHYLTFIL